MFGAAVHIRKQAMEQESRMRKTSRTVRGGWGWPPGYGCSIEALLEKTESNELLHVRLRRHSLILPPDQGLPGWCAARFAKIGLARAAVGAKTPGE